MTQRLIIEECIMLERRRLFFRSKKEDWLREWKAFFPGTEPFVFDVEYSDGIKYNYDLSGKRFTDREYSLYDTPEKRLT